LYSGDLVMEGGCVADAPGISIGHYTDTSAATGCAISQSLQGGTHMDRLLTVVAVVTSRAITSGVRKAAGLQGLPTVSDLTEAQHG